MCQTRVSLTLSVFFDCFFDHGVPVQLGICWCMNAFLVVCFCCWDFGANVFCDGTPQSLEMNLFHNPPEIPVSPLGWKTRLLSLQDALLLISVTFYSIFIQ